MGSADEAAADRDPLASGEGVESDGAATAVIDADGTVAGWTQAAHTLLGYTAREVLGRPLADLLAAADAGPFVTAVLRGAAAPGGWSGTVRLRHRGGHHLDVQLRISRLSTRDGATRWLAAASDGRAAAYRRLVSKRLMLLNEAGTRIGTTLDVMRTGQELADFVVPRLADYTTVDLAEAVPLGEEPLARLGMDAGRIPVFRRAGVASIHEGIPESLWELGQPVYVPSASPFTQVLTSGESYLEPVLNPSLHSWLVSDPQRSRVIHETGMHSVMMVAIQARGRVLGIAVFVRTDNPDPFERDDLLLAEELVDRAALSLDNANRYTRERAAALALQRDLLPSHVSGGPALDVDYCYLPADMEHGVGGDWYDVIPLPRDRVALVVGDVVGHGIAAAAAMGRLRIALHTLADMDLPPAVLLSRLDRTVVRLAQEKADHADLAVPSLAATCLYVVYDPIERLLDVTRAGHPPPVVVDPAGRATVPEVPAGVPIGLGVGLYESARMKIPDGTLIALYTDGLVESRSEDIESGIHRLAAALAHPPAALHELSAKAVATVRSDPPSDDATLLLARTRPLPRLADTGERRRRDTPAHP
ncbi:SpoIIE family protein phosphatase [Streptomyces sp. NPDC052207]|uniref:SpoIIE family protein phosphatase n=1 Tax=Streptomyces sp. NPDC052207 TaxID=3155418 RepID=UPI0034125699